ncbi:MAG: hypothetical protein ACOC26_04950, partial [Halochromatium sp.]
RRQRRRTRQHDAEQHIQSVQKRRRAARRPRRKADLVPAASPAGEAEGRVGRRRVRRRRRVRTIDRFLRSRKDPAPGVEEAPVVSQRTRGGEQGCLPDQGLPLGLRARIVAMPVPQLGFRRVAVAKETSDEGIVEALCRLAMSLG